MSNFSAMINTCSTLPLVHFSLLPPKYTPSAAFNSFAHARSSHARKRSFLCRSPAATERRLWRGGAVSDGVDSGGGEVSVSRETVLYSFAPVPLLLAAALPGAGAVRSLFGSIVEVVKTSNLPGWLVHWGHPGNMAVVLFAMGGYGTYLGFRIRFSDNVEEKAKAKDLHPKLLGGMFFFFALGATGGIISLLTSDRPILESPHAVTGFIGLALLTIQTSLPALFEGDPGLRTVHGILGIGIMTLFLFHSALGLQLGLSY